ncbi:hypothetical protein PC9H_010743 [Pleurotus ostreatus]|uniref:Uncharacterized protein n=2 Tax=Pleurotus TaxID=5320 RepID=A0A8H6ZS78_PLEOS|nr:uncharacterized protein PC9H_010743 [Pleurotus ostreatus]KAF7422587.1 hypothetical protein PC9H_010743 [Pleurotus ostreatus]KAG9227552.1 hypothetical protein CCMSSC00406_0000802 [Pleurotus cornucopiae]KAJ8691544.1 hypothetical protein PTI98_011106 [Pleurotus ostreatus]
MGVSVDTTASSIGTNNIHAVDNSFSAQSSGCSTTYNLPHTSKSLTKDRPTSTKSYFAKRRLLTIKVVLDETMAELSFISNHGLDEKQYDMLVKMHEEVSVAYHQLLSETRSCWDSLMNSGRAKELKEEAKDVRQTIMRVSEATKRKLARQRNTQTAAISVQPGAPSLALPESSLTTSCTHCQCRPVVINNFY